MGRRFSKVAGSSICRLAKWMPRVTSARCGMTYSGELSDDRAQSSEILCPIVRGI